MSGLHIDSYLRQKDIPRDWEL